MICTVILFYLQAVSSKHDLLILRKPSHTDITTNNFSVHPYRHKMAVGKSIFHILSSIDQSYSQTEQYKIAPNNAR